MRFRVRDLDIEALQQNLGVRLRNPQLLATALTHRSSIARGPLESYERLEFLGDAVFSLVVAEYLYRKFPELPEGELSHRRALLVNRQRLADAARRAGIAELSEVVRLREELGERAEDSVLADILEAVVGAVFLDRGYRVAARVVRTVLKNDFRLLDAPAVPADPKSFLQQLTQMRWRELPTYTTWRCDGDDHSPRFESIVSVHGIEAGHGTGTSKKDAERAAAAQALEALSKEETENACSHS